MRWQTSISCRVQRLENDLRRLPPTRRTETDYVAAWSGVRDARILAALPQVSPDLEPAWPAEGRGPDPARPATGWTWWNGDRTDTAYAAVDRADAAYLALAPEPILRQRARAMLARLAVIDLPPDDQLLTSYSTTLWTLAEAPVERAVSADTRSVLREICEALDHVEGSRHSRARAYRNLLLTAAAGLALVVLLLAAIGWRNPSLLSPCSSGDPPNCPGAGPSGPGDVFLLGLAGLAGGALGVLPMLVNGRGPLTLALAQAVLKLSAGAVVALAGVFVLQHRVLGILMPQSGDGLFAWAFIFGIAQQAITRAIDKRANALTRDPSPGGRGVSGRRRPWDF